MESASTVQPPKPGAGDPAAVLGVVIAGVVASFVVPGPYSWDTTLLGALLLLVLVGYGHYPQTRRQTMGTAAAAALALLFLTGHAIDVWLGDLLGECAALTGWPLHSTQPCAAPDESAAYGGWATALVWSALFVLSYRLLSFPRTRHVLGGRLEQPPNTPRRLIPRRGADAPKRRGAPAVPAPAVEPADRLETARQPDEAVPGTRRGSAAPTSTGAASDAPGDRQSPAQSE